MRTEILSYNCEITDGNVKTFETLSTFDRPLHYLTFSTTAEVLAYSGTVSEIVFNEETDQPAVLTAAGWKSFTLTTLT